MTVCVCVSCPFYITLHYRTLPREPSVPNRKLCKVGGLQSRFSVQSMRRAEEVETSCAVETVVEATFLNVDTQGVRREAGLCDCG